MTDMGTCVIPFQTFLLDLKYIYIAQLLPIRTSNYNFHIFKNIKPHEFDIWHMEHTQFTI